MNGSSSVVLPAKYLSYQDMDDISQFRKVSNSSATCDSRGELTAQLRTSVRYNLSLLTVLFVLLLMLVGLAGGIVGRLLSPVCITYQRPTNSEPINDQLDISLAEVIVASGRKVPIVRLPKQIRPNHYELNFKLVDRDSIDGAETITISCHHPTATISLHAKNLQISTIEVLDAQRNSLTVDHIDNSSETAMLSIHLAEELTIGNNYLIRVNFQLQLCSESGPISCDSDEVKNTFAFATKLEPIKARELFPCFDEPSLKATFNVSVSYQPRLFHTILSNEAHLSRKFHNGYVTDQFHRTPQMSTYLLALAGGNFRSRCGQVGVNLKLCIWAEPEDISQVDFALTTAVEMFEAIQPYFHFAYPLSKLDILGLHTYPTGAMENWGLIVHNFNTLTVGALQKDSLRHRQFLIAKIIAHEILHQWFGNLVTMEWWDELWLNEGFATFYSYHFLKTKYPDLVELDFIRQLTHLLNLQSKTDAKLPLLIDFHSTTDVDDIFDPLHLYSKGAMVVKMLFDLLGEKSLQSALVYYLNSNAYKSVTRHSLVEVLLEKSAKTQAKVDIQQLIDKWVTNPGYPEIYLIRDYHNNEIVVTQQPADSERHKSGFVQLSSVHTDSNATWPLPLLYMTKGQPVPNEPSVWTNETQRRFTELSLKANSWILANTGLQFAYRVNYDLTNWKLLVEQLHSNHKEIPFASRIQLIEDGDYFLKLNSHLISYLDLLGYLVYETEDAVLRQALPKLESLLALFRGSAVYPLLQNYFSSIVAQYVKISPKSSESACRLLCATGNPICKAKAQILPYSEDFSNVTSYCDTVYMCQHFQEFSTREEWQRLTDHKDKLRGMTLRTVVTCSSNRTVTELLLNTHLNSFSWAWIPSTLASPYSLVHNPIAYHSFWKGLAKLGRAQVKEMLQAELLRDGVNIIGAISSLSDLHLAKSILPKSYGRALDGAERKLEWIQEVTPSVQSWLTRKLTTIDTRRKAFRTLKG